MTWSLLNGYLASSVTALLDQANEGNTDRPDMENRAMAREQAEKIIHSVLWAYSSRSSDFAGAYAMDTFKASVGRDLAKWLVGAFEFDDKCAAPGSKGDAS